MYRKSRREFLSAAAAFSAAAAVHYFPMRSQAADRPRIRMGCIGLGPQGRGNAHSFNPFVDIVALCDLDPEYMVKQIIDKKEVGPVKNGERIVPDFVADYRRILDRSDIDAVCIATPDHWHTKIAVEALQAGKHVYCQKPLTLTLEENKLIRAAAAKYGKVFQVGSQRRTQKDQFLLAALIVRAGLLGKIHRITCCLKEGRQSGPLNRYALPRKLDWNTWIGQAPMVDYIASSAGPGKLWGGWGLPDQSNGHLTFRWWHNFAGGKITDWGAHFVDAALWAVNKQTQGSGPISVDGSGSEFLVPYKDGYPTVDNIYNTAIKFNIKCKYADGLQLDIVSNSPDGDGVLFEGEKGRIHVNIARIKGKLIEQGVKEQFTEKDYSAMYNGKPVESHWENFVRCIQEGGKPISDIESQIETMNVCHLAVIATRVNRQILWDPQKEEIVSDPLAASFMHREQRKGFELPSLS
ncbi:MAG: Gfo/Idh/MocA family oxidoreductase [Planctomycetia bacterium]|nr:Gfo/Idh/MocA family oxidoreductase [Planctomycetia bacterium]